MSERRADAAGGAHAPTRFGVLQIAARAGDLDGNASAVRRGLLGAVAAGCDIVVLPELVNSGYALAGRDEALELAEPAVGGRNTAEWESVAREHSIFVCAGFAERVGTSVYNSAVVFGPTGCVGIYRKTFLWDRERVIFDPGDGVFQVYELGRIRVGISICYDLWHPEVPRLLKLRGADVILSPVCWTRLPNAIGSGFPPALHLQLAHAHMNRVVIVCADHCGDDRDRAFLGESCIVGPDGFLLDPMGGEPGLAITDADPVGIARMHRLSDHSDALGDRRPAVIDVVCAPWADGALDLDRYPSGRY